MAERYPGGVISKTPPEVRPTASGANLYSWGSSSSSLGIAGNAGEASGVWTLDDVLGYQKAGVWPSVFSSAGSRSSPVSVGSLKTWNKVSTGNNLKQATKTDGTLWAWGSNSSGSLGDNTTVSKSSPIQIGVLTNWSSVSVGIFSVLAVKTDNTLWSWGPNNDGQLGQGDVANRSSPTQVGALSDWSQVSVGGNIITEAFCAAVKTDGTVWSWGRNTYGQLGDSSIVTRSSPVQIGALTDWAQVSAGNRHCAAVKTNGTLWTWGSNLSGEAGVNNTAPNRRSSPIQVGALTNWAQVSCAQNTFTVAVKTDGTIWSWGRNSYGALGLGDTVFRSSPVQIGSLTDWSQVSTGEFFCSAIKTDGTLWAWGRNNSGQIGDNTKTNRNSPVQVGAETDWSLVSARNNSIAAVTTG